MKNPAFTEGKYVGKVKTEQVKRTAKELMVKFPNKFSSNFDENKRLVNELTKGTTTRIRNQIAGYITSTISHSDEENSSEESEVEETEY